MKPTALLGMAQGKRHGFKDYVEPSKVSLFSYDADVQAMDSVLNACGKFYMLFVSGTELMYRWRQRPIIYYVGL